MSKIKGTKYWTDRNRTAILWTQYKPTDTCGSVFILKKYFKTGQMICFLYIGQWKKKSIWGLWGFWWWFFLFGWFCLGVYVWFVLSFLPNLKALAFGISLAKHNWRWVHLFAQCKPQHLQMNWTWCSQKQWKCKVKLASVK